MFTRMVVSNSNLYVSLALISNDGCLDRGPFLYYCESWIACNDQIHQNQWRIDSLVLRLLKLHQLNFPDLGAIFITVNQITTGLLIMTSRARTFWTSPSRISRVVGLLSIFLSTTIALMNDCPTKGQYYIIYVLSGLGITILLAKSAGQSKAEFKLYNISVSLIGAVVIPLVLIFTNPIGSFKSDKCDLTVSVTIFVHGKMGRQDMILRRQGYVLMDLKGGERKSASIDEHGSAVFQNLHIGDSVRLEIDFSEPYKAIHHDSIYTIPVDGRIYFPVALRGIDKVTGKVLFDDTPLPLVCASIGTLIDTTDQLGNFSIDIPDSLQQKEYRVWFSKSGFKTISESAFPQTGEPLQITMIQK